MNTADMVEVKPSVKVRRPRRQIHETPRILMADAYTIGSNPFESVLAQEKSVYYSTYRKLLNTINPNLYKTDDTRIVFKGITRLVDYLLYEPITHAEIDEAKRFLEHQLITGDGLTNYYFPEELWRRVVDEFDGWVPIKISAVREGSVVYPNEPVMMVNPTKGKQLSNMRSSGADEAIVLVPAWEITIERGLEIMNADEYLEVTPKSVRLRKQLLTESERSRAGRKS
jgi:hypothetical protein